jgi:deazaflavin-dependent oxidoreductase (nitroreductase family)
MTTDHGEFQSTVWLAITLAIIAERQRDEGLEILSKKSGQEWVIPMMYLELDGHIDVFASNAGANTDPDWHRNLVANPGVTVEIGSESVAANAVPVLGNERDRIYAIQAARYPGFAQYEEKTSRVIPVVEPVRR